MWKNKTRQTSKQQFTDVQTQRKNISDSNHIQQKFYGFVDQPDDYTHSYNTFQRQDLKVVRFNEQGQFCVETSSFV